MADNEREFAVKLKAVNENHQEDMERAALEKEAQRLQLEEARDKMVSEFTIAAEDAAAVHAAEKDALAADIDALQKVRGNGWMSN